MTKDGTIGVQPPIPTAPTVIREITAFAVYANGRHRGGISFDWTQEATTGCVALFDGDWTVRDFTAPTREQVLNEVVAYLCCEVIGAQRLRVVSRSRHPLRSQLNRRLAEFCHANRANGIEPAGRTIWKDDPASSERAAALLRELIDRCDERANFK